MRSTRRSPSSFWPLEAPPRRAWACCEQRWGLDHDLLDVLAQWSPGLPKLLIVDALDAPRTDPQADSSRTLVDLVRVWLPEWRVVVSVRRWDLRHSPRLAQFPGPPTCIAELDDGELAQVASEWRELAELVESAPDDLRQLLRNPFNLRLVAELLLAGTALTELCDIHDRLEFLNRHWHHRVSDEPGRIGRYVLLARTCEYTATNRTLSARRCASSRRRCRCRPRPLAFWDGGVDTPGSGIGSRRCEP